MLLDNHADVRSHNWEDEIGPSPLNAAASHGCAATAELLLKAGEDPNRLPRFAGSTPLAAAAAVDREFASSEAAASTLRVLLAHGANVNAGGPWLSPLGSAARSCRIDNANVLLDHGADINGGGGELVRGVTPLMAAADGLCEPITTLLLAKGARVNQTDAAGKTALFHAIDDDIEVRFAHSPANIVPVATRLIEAGASPNITPRGKNAGVTPLMLALKRNETKPLVEMLIAKGADPKAIDGQGRSVLMYAIEREDVETFQALLARGAPVNARDRNGLTALDHTQEVRNESARNKIVAVLKAAGAVE